MNLPSDVASTATADSRAEESPAGFRRLARQITRRTTDLLAIAIVTVCLLAIGGQVSQWWQTSPDDVSPSNVPGYTGTAWGAGGTPVSLEFEGLAFTLRRQTVAGDEQAAAEGLMSAAREIAAGNAAPAGEIEKSERALLEALRALEPADEVGTSRIYRFDLPLPMVLVTRRDSSEDDGRAAKERAERQDPLTPPGSPLSTRAEEAAERVVCWGRAFPVGETSWRLFLFHSPHSGAASAGAGDIPLPPRSRRLHSIRDHSGLCWIGFTGAGSPRQWMRFFDGSLAERGWERTSEWRIDDRSCAARFISASDSAGTVDVHFSTAGQDQLSGIISVAQ